MERNERLTEALEGLLDPHVVRRFREDPEGTFAHLGLTGDEIDALKSGDELRLRAAGADLTVMDGVVPRRPRLTNRMLGGLARFAPRVAAIALAALVVAGSSIRGVRARMDACRYGRKSQIPRMSRYDARKDVRFGSGRYNPRRYSPRRAGSGRYSPRAGIRAGDRRQARSGYDGSAKGSHGGPYKLD